MIPDDTHHFLRHANSVKVDAAVAAFFERVFALSRTDFPVCCRGPRSEGRCLESVPCPVRRNDYTEASRSKRFSPRSSGRKRQPVVKQNIRRKTLRSAGARAPLITVSINIWLAGPEHYLDIRHKCIISVVLVGLLRLPIQREAAYGRPKLRLQSILLLERSAAIFLRCSRRDSCVSAFAT